jgi:fibrillarin-like pre-rRNA processing protein
MSIVDPVIWFKVDSSIELATLNLIQGNTVYGEKLIKHNGNEYRIWDPYRSKLAAGLKKGLRHMPIINGTKLLYLGASTGTTVSHVSDIIGVTGLIFAVESAARVARELIENVASKRSNVLPILEDARKPRSYFSIFGQVDVIYCDIAQPDQTAIAIENCFVYLKPKGRLLITIKARSIDVVEDPKVVIAKERKRLEINGFEINQTINLEPFDKDHGLIHATYKGR